MHLLRIGYLAGVVVVKAMPDYDAYLCKFIDSQILALLPRRWALRHYKVGETAWAAIYDINGARITLSQKSTQYIRKILEYLLSSACMEHNLKFKKIARMEGARFAKAAVEPMDGDILDSKELYGVLKPYVQDIHLGDYLTERVSFVRYSRDIREYVVNALCPPGPNEKILKVIHHEEMNKVSLLVDNGHVGLFVGEKGRNVMTAKKLCEVDIEIKGISGDTMEKYYRR